PLATYLALMGMAITTWRRMPSRASTGETVAGGTFGVAAKATNADAISGRTSLPPWQSRVLYFFFFFAVFPTHLQQTPDQFSESFCVILPVCTANLDVLVVLHYVNQLPSSSSPLSPLKTFLRRNIHSINLRLHSREK